MSRRITQLVLAVVGLLGTFVLLTGTSAAAGTSITTVITDTAKTPVAGVSVVVTGDGGFSGKGTTDAKGVATIAVPKSGKYQVTVDENTIPGDAAVNDGPTRSVNVLMGDKKVLYIVGGANTGESTGGNSKLSQVPQLLVDGLILSLLIALGALGLNLIFGTTGLTNFAHGEMLTLGAFTAYVLNHWFGLNLIIAAPLAIVLSAALWGWGQNQILWRPLRKRKTGLIAAMIVSIGLAITVRYALLLIFGGSPKSYDQFAGQPGLEFGPISVTPKAIVLSILAIIALAGTVWWLRSSRIGKATRAVSDNPALASASGVNVERVISVVWVLGAGLAAFAGVFLGMTQNVVWTMGQYLLLTMFAAIVLGGLGTIGGALVGSLVVGVTVQLSTLIVPAELKTAAALALMIILLLVRPQGLLGRPERVG